MVVFTGVVVARGQNWKAYYHIALFAARKMLLFSGYTAAMLGCIKGLPMFFFSGF